MKMSNIAIGVITRCAVASLSMDFCSASDAKKGRSAKIPRDCGVARRADCVAAIFTNAIPAVGCDLDRQDLTGLAVEIF